MPSRQKSHRFPRAGRPHHEPTKAYEASRAGDARLSLAKAIRSSARWQKARAAKLRAQPTCEECARLGNDYQAVIDNRLKAEKYRELRVP